MPDTPPTTVIRIRRRSTWRARLVNGAFILVLCGPVVAISWDNLREAAASSTLVELARRIEYRRSVDPAAIEAMLPRVDRVAGSDMCDDAANRAAVTIALVALQQQNQARDFEGWSASLQRSTDILRASLRCTPLNGNFWARLALNERAAAPASPRMGEMARFSLAVSPAEAGSLMTRAEIWRSSPWLDAETAKARETDFQTILTKAREPDVVRMFRAAPPEIEAEVTRMMIDLPVARRESLERAGLFAEPAPKPKPRQDGYFGGLFPGSAPLHRVP